MARLPNLDFYRDADKRWRWRFRSNGYVLSDGGQGYSRRIDCVAGALYATGCMPITWHGEKPFRYGQTRRVCDVIEVRVLDDKAGA